MHFWDKWNKRKTTTGKWKKIFGETSLAGFGFAALMYVLTNAVFFSSKGQWQEANQFYEVAIAAYRKSSPATGIEAGMRRGYLLVSFATRADLARCQKCGLKEPRK